MRIIIIIIGIIDIDDDISNSHPINPFVMSFCFCLFFFPK